MPAALPTPDEHLRVELLRVLGLLDSPPEAAYDRIARLAAHILDTPMALVSFIDEERQWFKSRVGVPMAELPRDIAFCAHAIHGRREPFIVEDTLKDTRFADNPLVLGQPGVRFYAGVPLSTTTGVTLGTLCVLDLQPRVLTAAQTAALQDLAGLANEQIARAEHAAALRQVNEHSVARLQETETRFRATFEQAAVGISLVGLDGRWLRVNDRFAAIVGYGASELDGLKVRDITHPDDLALDLQRVRALLSGEAAQYQAEVRYIRRDGHAVWIHLTVSLVRDAAGQPDYFIAVVEDIDERKRAEAALQALRHELEDRVESRTQELRAVLEHANNAYVCVNEAGWIVEWNREATRLFGWTREEALQRRMDDTILPPSYRAGHQANIQRFLVTGTGGLMNQRREMTASTKDGRIIPVELTLHSFPTPKGHLFCAFLHDITERKVMQAELEAQAREDELTGLPNRRQFQAQLARAVALADRQDTRLALLFVDLDGFKAVNDRYGHEAGDAVLRQFAHRLREGVRKSDFVARLSGDEFVVLATLTGAADHDGMALMDKIEDLASQPFEHGGHRPRIGASVGLQLYTPNGGQTASAFLAAADEAMYQRKRQRKAAGSRQVQPVA